MSGLKILSGPLHPKQTADWIITRQSPVDYGFQDYSEMPESTYSSAILSYYAVDTLGQLDSKYIESYLKPDMWELEVNPWYVVAIVAGVVGVLVIAGILIWKYKNRV